jgi:hypothetical protein
MSEDQAMPNEAKADDVVAEVPRPIDTLQLRFVVASKYLESLGCRYFMRAGDQYGSLAAVIGKHKDGQMIAASLQGDRLGLPCPECHHQLSWHNNEIRCFKCQPLQAFKVRRVCEFIIEVEADTAEEALKKADRMYCDSLVESDDVLDENYSVSLIESDLPPKEPSDAK